MEALSSRGHEGTGRPGGSGAMTAAAVLFRSRLPP